METDLQLLGERVRRLLEITRQLSDENQLLRGRLGEAAMSQADMQQRRAPPPPPPRGGAARVGYPRASADAQDDSVAAIQAAVAGALPSAARPNAIVVVDEFPRTPTGKIDRARLPLPQTDKD